MAKKILSAILFLALWTWPMLGAQPEETLAETMSSLASKPDLVLLKTGPFDPLAGVPLETSFGASELRDRNEGVLHYVVQFPCTPGEQERELLDTVGAEILFYLPNNAYLVRMESSRFASLEFAQEVRAAFRLPKFAKVDPALRVGPGQEKTLELICTPGASGSPVAGRIAKEFPAVRFITRDYHHQGGRVVCAVPAADLDAFLDEVSGLEDVLSVMPWEEKILLNDNSIWVIQNYDTTNKTTYSLSATIWNHGILGTGQIACVNDSGMRNTSCFFKYGSATSNEATAQTLTPPDTGTITSSKKCIAYYVEPGAASYDTSSASYHGTHTCGTVLGDNYASLSTSTTAGHDSGDGMAPNAKLVMQDVGDAAGDLTGLNGDLTTMFLQAYNAGARIHSDSWGTTVSNYDATALDMDEFTYRYEDFLFVVAMGNSGTGQGDGSIGAPATAKDVVSVMATSNGSSSNANNLTSYSRGPVDDGRRKPDVCAPGSNVNSANGGSACGTQSMSGTSMATPTTAGGLVLLRQYFTDGWYPTGTKTAADTRNPSAALMKACLVNGAMEVTGTDPFGTIKRIPSMDQGWGRVHLENALYFSGDARRTRLWDVRNADGLTTGQQAEYTINVTANTQPLKVHLVWSDPESTTLASVNLVNNLDLEVVNPSGTVYKGNVFATGQSTTGGTADVLNNVEGFVLSSPATGSWTLRVKATSVPGTGTAPNSNRQGYALVATYATCTSAVAAPTGLTATNNGTTGIDLSWGTVSGATGYIVYKAKGASPAAGDYSVLVQQTGTTFTDTNAQGGYTYSYKVRATDNCSESAVSSSATATYSGNCILSPSFGGVTSISNDLATGACDLVLGWSAGTSLCPLGIGVTYNIYRGTTPYFVPGGTNRVAAGVAATTYRDTTVTANTTYYYVVRAEDSTTANGGPANGGNQETNSVMVQGTPTASTASNGTWADAGGDNGLARLSLSTPWRVTNLQNHTTGGSLCYHSAADGSFYPSNTCAAATTPSIALQAGQSPVLTFWERFNLEYQFDGVTVEISDNGGAWTQLAISPDYPQTFAQTTATPINECGYATTVKCFSGPNGNAAMTAWTSHTASLSSYAGHTVQIRWRLSTDPGAEYDGFYLDDIQITYATTPDACTACAAPAVPSAPAVADLDACALSGVSVSWSPVSGASSYDLQVDGTTTVTGVTSPATYTPGNSSSHSYTIRANGTCGSSAYSAGTAGTDAVCAVPGEVSTGATSGAAQTWSADKRTTGWQAASGTVTGYRLYKGLPVDLPKLLNSTADACLRYQGTNLTYTLSDANDAVAGGTFLWYLVTAYNGAGPSPAGNATAGARDLTSTGTCTP